MSNTGKRTRELDFEQAIEAWLVEHGGYTKADSSLFDAALGLDSQTLLAFLNESQAKTWQKLASSYGASVEEQVIKRIASECDARGLLDVVRNGVRDRGQTLRLAYFRPPTSLNPDTERRYRKNRLTIMRQVAYDLDSRKTIDMLLSLNGLPIATVELKNAFTGQRSSHAIKQYIKRRVPTRKTPLIQHKKRALVHFAVDTDEVYMTTRLAGDKTFFLPFNTGNQGGKGNPVDHDYVTGYKTGYLWEEVWQRDSWLDLIHRFIHLQVEERRDAVTGKTTRKETLIFPRYHQLAATRQLLADTRKHGVGKSYLIQHSAGSGKTNTISWSAHQLASLHGPDNQPIFNSIVVVSDRRNLDKQLQDNIYQIEHKKGVVAKIDEEKHASDLAKELNAGTKIIITTLQKFSFLMDQVKDLSDRTFAVMIDEAHSSQSGRSAGNLRGVLGGGLPSPLVLGGIEGGHLAAAEAEEANNNEAPTIEDFIVAEARRRGPQANISFYAFTATPKHKTLELFGIVDQTGKPQPFHLYSMRQAIEERFIHDVLKQYSTYKTYYQLSKALADDPELSVKQAKKAIARFVSLHPHNIGQKIEIMVEHFRRFTRQKIDGKAKAMIVTRSRLHVVRYKQAFDAYIKKQGYQDIKALVAFSGTVNDPDLPDLPDMIHTEASMNGFSAKEVPHRFATPDYQLLIVAEKYQTGFDQPLLHTMFVDKRLADLKAVQTLSRLNRTTSGKVDTFVLDFANDVEAIQDAFKPYFEQTEIDTPTDPNQLYTLDRQLRDAPVLRADEIDEFAAIYFKPHAQQTKSDHGQLNRWIDFAVERYKEAYSDASSAVGQAGYNYDNHNEEGDAFKCSLQRFVRLYSFLSQLIDWQDIELEKLYAYARHLLTKLPYRSRDSMLTLNDEVELYSYRNEKTFEGSAALTIGESQLVYGSSQVSSSRKEDHTSPLSTIIELINSRFDTDWSEADQLFFEQISGDVEKDRKLTEQAQANTKEQFKPVFSTEVMRAFIKRFEGNEQLVTKLMNNPDMCEVIIDALLEEVYNKV